jgi:hypothetical protein
LTQDQTGLLNPGTIVSLARIAAGHFLVGGVDPDVSGKPDAGLAVVRTLQAVHAGAPDRAAVKATDVVRRHQARDAAVLDDHPEVVGIDLAQRLIVHLGVD